MSFQRQFDSLFLRIMARVIVLEWQNENGCWLFTGKLDKWGYGRVNVRIAGVHTTLVVHRAVWEIIKGPIPKDMTLDHGEHCIANACCNPDHLEVVTNSENAARAWRRNPRGFQNGQGRRKHQKASV